MEFCESSTKVELHNCFHYGVFFLALICAHNSIVLFLTWHPQMSRIDVFRMIFPHVSFAVAFVTESLPARKHRTSVQVNSFEFGGNVSIQLKLSSKSLSTFRAQEFVDALVFLLLVFCKAELVYEGLEADFALVCFSFVVVLGEDVLLVRRVSWRLLVTVGTMKHLGHFYIWVCSLGSSTRHWWRLLFGYLWLETSCGQRSRSRPSHETPGGSFLFGAPLAGQSLK